MTTPTLLGKKGLLKFLEAFATVNWVFLRILELYLCANIKSLIIGCTYSLLPPDYFFNTSSQILQGTFSSAGTIMQIIV